MKIRKTNKLFYKKYAYKVEARIKGAHLIRPTADHAIEICNQRLSNNAMFSYKFKYINDDEIRNLIKFIKSSKNFLDQGIKTRGEMSTFNFYIEDEKTFNKVVKKLSPWIRSVYKPESKEDLFQLLDNKKITLCDKLPLKKYRYRLFLNRRMPEHRRESFIKWTENYGDAIKFSGKSEKWMHGIGWMYDPFMYVEDNKLLLMVKMSLGENVIKTEEFVLRNTVK